MYKINFMDTRSSEAASKDLEVKHVVLGSAVILDSKIKPSELADIQTKYKGWHDSPSAYDREMYCALK
jgi:hypothetical protein